MKKTNKLKEFQLACKGYLFSLGINDLRAYGREIGVARPTTKNKDDLIAEIVAILSGELAPIAISNQGAPVKNNRVDDRILAKIAEIRKTYAIDEIGRDEKPLIFFQPSSSNAENGWVSKTEKIGQIHFFEDGYYAISSQCNQKGEMFFIDDSYIKEFDLREGDIIEFFARKIPGDEVVVDEILTVNGIHATASIRRADFNTAPIYPSKERIRLFDEKNFTAPILKYLEWLMPLSRGKRGCIIAPPKAGKSRVLLQVAQAASVLNPDVEVYALLLEQSPEIIYEYKNKILEERLFYTTYEDSAEKNVLLANFLLNRLKRRAESGKNILLIVDSFSVLARSFNDMEETMGGRILSCGLNQETVRYLRKYFGAARCLEYFGSISILGGVNQSTGNPFDEAVCAEISAQANYEIRLDGELAKKRIYPAVDVLQSSIKDYDVLQDKREEELDAYLRGKILPKIGIEELLHIISRASSYQDFLCEIEKI